MSLGASAGQVERFVEKWRGVELSERAASHEHFIDLCRLVGEATPAESDPTDEDYCFEKAMKVTRGGCTNRDQEFEFWIPAEGV